MTWRLVMCKVYNDVDMLPAGLLLLVSRYGSRKEVDCDCYNFSSLYPFIHIFTIFAAILSPVCLSLSVPQITSHVTFLSISVLSYLHLPMWLPPLLSRTLLTHPCLLSYLRRLVLYLDRYLLWQAPPRPFLYLTIACTMTKP